MPPQEFLITTSSNLESDKNNRFWMYIDISEINQMVSTGCSRTAAAAFVSLFSHAPDLLSGFD
jgi:hypothetical protein